MTIPFDTDWRHITHRPDAASAMARWARSEPALAGADLDELRRRAQCRDDHTSDTTLAALLRLAEDDPLARRVIVEALMSRLIPIAGSLARRNAAPYDDVLAELAGWAWELAATTPHDRWQTHLAPNLARLAKRRYLSAHTLRPADRLEDRDIPAADRLDHGLGAYAAATLLRQAVTTGTISPAGARILATLIRTGGTDATIARHLGRTPASTKKARERALAQLRTWPPAAALRAA